MFMLTGKDVCLRPIRSEDWQIFEEWGKKRENLWGLYQRFQVDHLSLLRDAFRSSALLGREGDMLLIETLEEQRVVGFVQHSMLSTPDAEHPYPEIGFGVPDIQARRNGYGKEAVALLLDYLFSGYPTERIAAYTDVDNIPAQHLLEHLGFKQEGVICKCFFCDGAWQDIALYGILRDELLPSPKNN
jgi:RimJ/RimL family protein N-acetyltransferase